MGYAARVIADSISPDRVRLTTMEVTFPRIVLAEFNTHRMLSRSSASSRAIPVEKMLQRVTEDPFIPIWWGKNQKGMQAAEELEDEREDGTNPRASALDKWLRARDQSVESVRRLQEVDLHKQIANRLLEPFLWHTVIVTATEWANFFALRCHKDAQPEIRVIAEMMRKLYQENTPSPMSYGCWHLPLVDDADLEATRAGRMADPYYLAKVSSGRCARVSYLTHDGRRDPVEDVALADRLRASGHMSPFEHAATPIVDGETRQPFTADNRFIGNFRGWVQYRKMLPNEAVFQAP